LSAIGRNEIKALKPGHMLTFCSGDIIEKKVAGFTPDNIFAKENAIKDILFKGIEQSVKQRYYQPCALAFPGDLTVRSLPRYAKMQSYILWAWQVLMILSRQRKLRCFWTKR